MVYDYRLDDAGVSRRDDEDDDEDRKVSHAPGQQLAWDQNHLVLVLMAGCS